MQKTDQPLDRPLLTPPFAHSTPVDEDRRAFVQSGIPEALLTPHVGNSHRTLLSISE